ncbi:MAG: HesA/MoeB/ThiF family protein [Reinekea sp.]|jgi:molybdopterin-synthase adenylyltransferase
MTDLTDDQLLRYARNILLPQVDVAGQARLLAAHVAVIGAGGLGTPLLQYLAASGVGTLTVVDDDVVEETNLQRQVIFNHQHLGQAKVSAAAEVIAQLNPEIQVNTHQYRLDDTNVADCLRGAELVVIGTDNFSSRYIVNRYCHQQNIPLVTGAAIGTSGQITSFNFQESSRPCFQCVYEQGDDEALTCATAGVLGPVVGTVGSVMAMEVIKILLNIGQPLYGRLLVWDALAMQWQTFQYGSNDACPVCGV